MAVSRHKQARATRKVETAPGETTTCDRTTPDSESGDESYFGGKGGCFRHLINQIPPHDTLYIPFAGHCAIARNIKPPETIFLNDLDKAVTSWWRRHLEVMTPNSASEYPACQFKITSRCGIECLEDLSRDARCDAAGRGMKRSFIYLDPPYLPGTLTSESRYRYKLTYDDHVRLLAIILELPCRIMISGYWSKLYAKELASWRHFDFPSATHGGQRTEHVWCNYSEPTELQDYRYLGRDRRERFKLLRREQNLIEKLSRLPEIERNALLAAVDSHFGGGRSR
jgi:DNA adenine methylase